GAAGFARVCISGACFERQNEAEQSTQSGRACRTVSRYPNRVRNDNRIRPQVRLRFCDDLFEVGRADLLFKLPQKPNVDRNVRFNRRTRAEKGAERGAFVVGGAAAVVSVALLSEGKRLGVPRLSF